MLRRFRWIFGLIAISLIAFSLHQAAYTAGHSTPSKVTPKVKKLAISSCKVILPGSDDSDISYLNHRIQRVFSYLLSKQGIITTGNATYRFTLNQAGYIQSLIVKKSSKNPDFVEIGKQAITLAGPFMSLSLTKPTCFDIELSQDEKSVNKKENPDKQNQNAQDKPTQDGKVKPENRDIPKNLPGGLHDKLIEPKEKVPQAGRP